MRRVVSALAMLTIATVTPTGLQAQDLAAMCENFSAPADGNWAEYSAKGNGMEGRIRFAILSAGESGGKLLELKVSDFGGQSMIMQVNIPGYPFGADEVTRVVMKASGQPAMILPSHMVQMSNVTLPVASAQDCVEAEFLGIEDIDVEGVTYEAYHIRPANQEQVEVWMTTEVPFGIIKAESVDGEMLLLEHGVGAVSSITETPISIPGM